MFSSGTGGAGAATSVLSDHVRWTGFAPPPTPAGNYSFQSHSCKLTSDGETGAFACELSGQLFPGLAPGQFSGSLVLQSADGTTSGSFTLTPTSTPGTSKLKGTGTENDAAEPGQPAQSYPCRLGGRMLFTQYPDGSYSITGTLTVRESSTRP